MKSWKMKFTGLVLVGLLMSLLCLTAMPVMAGTTNELYFDPGSVDVTNCPASIDIKLIAEISEANPVVATNMSFDFDNTSLQITDAVGNSEDWYAVTVPDLPDVNANGDMTITTTVGLNPAITGTIEVLTLTLECIDGEGSLTPFTLTSAEYINDKMETITLIESEDASPTPEVSSEDTSTSSKSSTTSSSSAASSSSSAASSLSSAAASSSSLETLGEIEPTTVELNGLMSASDLAVDENGRIQAAHRLTSLDEGVFLDIAEGTKMVDAQGGTIESLSVSKAAILRAPPADHAVICRYDFGPDGTTFDPPITLTIMYDDTLLTEGMVEDELYIANWDGQQWVPLESVVDADANMIWTEISHFSQFIVVGELISSSTPIAALAELPAPAVFTLTELSVSPREVRPAEMVTISALVTNTGDSEGNYTVVLKINDVEEARKELTIAADQSETVTFDVARDKEGTYAVDINGEVAQFTITGPAQLLPPAPAETTTFIPTEWWLYGGIAAGCILVILVAIFSLRRRW